MRMINGNMLMKVVFLVALLVLGVLPACAQHRSVREDPAVRQMQNRYFTLADGLVKQARAAMRKGDLTRAVELAERGVEDLTAWGGLDDAMEAREILAEIALLEGRPADTLRQAGTLSPYLVSKRFAMTKALALIELGHIAEARAMVLKEIGTVDQPNTFREGEGLYRFPVDDDPSVQALKATAFMLRATWWRHFPNWPETIADFRTALRLALGSATLHLEFARSLADLGAYEEAKTELSKAGNGTDPHFQQEVRMTRTSLGYGITNEPDRLKKMMAIPVAIPNAKPVGP